MSEEQTFTAPTDDAPAGTPFNLNEALNAAMDEIDARNAAEETPRDERGRFLSRDPNSDDGDGLTNAGEPPEAAKEDQPETEAAPEAEPLANESEAPKPAGNDNPLGWKAEEKAVFDALPEDVQLMVTERFKQVQGMATRKAQEVGQFGQIGQTLHENVYAPRLQQMQAQGINPVQRTAELFAYADAMAANPVATMQRLMQETGVTVQQLAQAAGVSLASADSWDYEPQQPDPTSTTEQLIAKALQPLMQRLEAQDAAAQQAQMASIEGEIESFRNTTGADGAPLYPHFDDVFDDMLASVQTLRASRPNLSYQETLKQAYSMAVGMNPQVQQRIDTARRAQEALQRDAKAKAAKGKVRNVQPTGTPTSQAAPQKGKTMRDTMLMVYNETNG